MKRLITLVILLLLSAGPASQPPVQSARTSPLTVMAFYYPWYHPVDGTWEDGCTGEPMLGYYESDNQTLISQEAMWARGHGVDGFFIEWTGLRAMNFDATIKIMLSNPDFNQLKFSLTYAAPMALGTVWDQALPPGEADWSVNCSDTNVRARFLADIDYAAGNYFTRPNFLKVNGRPTFYVWASAPLYGDVTGMLEQARNMTEAKYGFRVYFIGEELGWHASPDPDKLRAFDALMPYVMLNQDVPYNQKYTLGSTIDDIIGQYIGWFNLCRDVNVGFIPNVNPGYDDKNRTAYYQVIDGKIDTPAPVELRSVTDFRRYCELARDLVDPNLGIISVASWNEWYEGSTIEPSKGYGFDYLNIVKETLYGYTPQAGGTNQVNILKLSFSKVARPSDTEENSTDTRLLAAAFDYLSLFDMNKNELLKIDVGSPSARQYLGLGWSGDENTWGEVENFAWSGGSDKLANVYVQIPKQSIYLRFYAIPYQSGNVVKVSVGNETLGEATLTPGWAEYTFPIAAGSVTLNVDPQSVKVKSSVAISGKATPKLSTPVHIKVMSGTETVVTADVKPNSDGQYAYNWTAGRPGDYKVSASIRGPRDTSATSNVSLSVTKLPSEITCTASKGNLTVGDAIQLTGTLKPVTLGTQVSVKLTKPDGQTSETILRTNSEGGYRFNTTATELGAYTVAASWPGDEYTEGSNSKPIRLTVDAKPAPQQTGGVPGYPPIALIFGLITALSMLFRTPRVRSKATNIFQR